MNLILNRDARKAARTATDAATHQMHQRSRTILGKTDAL